MKPDDPRVQDNIEELAQALAKAEDPELITGFLKELLTLSEIADIAARWALVKELSDKKPHREIAKNLGVSLCKITRGSRELKKTDSVFRKFLSLNSFTKSAKCDIVFP
ncbi:MAG: trp operon repressor [Treponema sp.]|jgi:TrpR family trp operon transcriptional repressor|nr:trp operon repressor [Treponema sp.]